MLLGTGSLLNQHLGKKEYLCRGSPEVKLAVELAELAVVSFAWRGREYKVSPIEDICPSLKFLTVVDIIEGCFL